MTPRKMCSCWVTCMCIVLHVYTLYFGTHTVTCSANLLCQFTGLVRSIHDLVEEHRIVKSEAESDGMCGWHFFLSKFICFLVRFVRFVYHICTSQENTRWLNKELLASLLEIVLYLIRNIHTLPRTTHELHISTDIAQSEITNKDILM